MNNARVFNEAIAQLIVAQVAPEELPVFVDLAELYFADPTPPDLSLTPDYDPLSIGLGELLVAVTPAATAVVVYALTSLSKQSSASSSDWQDQQKEWQHSFSYEVGLQQLFNRIPPQHAGYSDLLLFQTRLIENTERMRRFGDTAELRADRFQIVEQLNHLAQSAVGESFNVLCGMDGGLGQGEWQQMREGGKEVAESFGMPAEMADQITEAMMIAFLTVLWSQKSA